MLKSDRSQEKELKDGPKKTLFENSPFKISLFRDLPHEWFHLCSSARYSLPRRTRDALSPVVFPQLLVWFVSRGKRMRRTLLQKLRLSPRSASTSSTRIYASFRSATFTASARSSSGRRSGRSDHPGAESSSSMATIAANDIKERRRLRFFLSPSSSFTSSTRERAFGNDRRQRTTTTTTVKA